MNSLSGATNALPHPGSLPPIVLLLDDERDILEMYSAHFEAEGIWVATAASAREGIEAVEELRPDLIITDIGFGSEPSGVTFVEAMKDRPHTAGIPLIVLTGSLLSDLPSGLRDDADLFLRKPVAPHALLVDVRRLLESSRRPGRLEQVGVNAVHPVEASRALPQRSGRDVSPTPKVARCPKCCEPLKWREHGRVDGRAFEYYDWCAQGCGLFCFDHAVRTLIRLV